MQFIFRNRRCSTWTASTPSALWPSAAAPRCPLASERCRAEDPPLVADAAGQKGTGRWTVQEALELGSPVTAIAESVFARALSSSEPAMRKEAQEVLPAGIGDTTEDVVKDPEFVDDVRKALYAPLRQIAQNAGHDGAVVSGKLLDQTDTAFGFNAATDTYENLVAAGVIDPTKVVRTALQDAASVQRGRYLFNSRGCTECHGADGTGGECGRTLEESAAAEGRRGGMSGDVHG